MTTKASMGRCQFCSGEFGRSGMTRHLQACQVREEAASARTGKNIRPANLLHVVVSGRHLPMYWLHVEVPGKATLGELDDFLRGIWLECCGHLSEFTIGGVSYVSSVDPDWGMDALEMDVELGKVLQVGDGFRHEYDFGSTTYLNLKVVSERRAVVQTQDIMLLAQNLPPVIPCQKCGRVATQLCAECIWDDEGWLCEECSETHKCGEEMLLPVVNSPRVGVCGYTG